MLHFTLLALLDNLCFTRLQLRIDAHLDLKRRVLGPLNSRRGRLALSTDLDDLLDRIGHTLGLGLRVRDLRVHDGLSRGHLVLTQLAFLDSFLLSGFQVLVEDDLGLERHVLFVLSRVSAFSFGTYTDDLLGRFLGALSGHGWLAIWLAVLDLLSRGHNLGTSLTLLINLLFALLEGVVEDDLGLERNRLVNLGHNSGVLSCRTVLDDLLDRILRLLLLRGDRCLVTLSLEVSGVGLLARHALLDNLDLTRLEFRVRTCLNLERNLGSPGHLLGSLRRLGTNLDHLINWLFSDLFLDGGFTIRLRVGDLLSHSNGLLTRLALGHSFRGASRQIRVELDLHAERNFSLDRVLNLTGGLGTNADLLRFRFLGALSGHGRVARRLTVHNLLSRGHDLGSQLTLLVDDLFTGRQSVIKDNLGLERNRLLSLGHQLAWSQTRTVLDDALDGFLGGLFFNYLGLVSFGTELGREGLLAVLAFLNNPGFTRLQVRVLANLSWVRNWDLPSHFLRALGGLGSNEHNFVDRLLGAFPGAVLVLLLLAWLTLGFSPVFASRDGVVVLVLDLERNLAGRNVNNVHHRVSSIRRTIFVGHCDRNLDLVAGLRIRRCGRGDLTVVVDTDIPPGGNIAQLIGVVLGNVDVVRLVELHWQSCRLARVDRLFRVGRIRLPVVGQLHHCGDGHLGTLAVWRFYRDSNGLLVTRLGVCRWGGGNDTGCLVDLVLPAVYFLLGFRRAVFVLAERKLRALRGVGHVVVHGLVRACGFYGVDRSHITLEHDDGALHRLRFVSVVVVSEHRHIQDVSLRCGLRDRGGDFAGGFVDLDFPRTTVIGDRHLGLAVFEGVALGGFVGCVTAQATLGERGLKAHTRVGLVGHRVVGRDLDVHDGLEIDLDLVGRLVRVGSLHLRGDDSTRCDRVVSLRSDLAGVIDCYGPAVGHSGGVNFVLCRVDRLVALHDGLKANLGGDVFVELSLRKARAHQVGDLRVVRVNNDE